MSLSRQSLTRRANLPAGLIFTVAERSGIQLRGTGPKRRIRCPFHQDRHPSAVLFEKNVFHCSVCGSKSLKDFTTALGVALDLCRPVLESPRVMTSSSVSSRFSATDAKQVWRLAVARARGESQEADADVYQYVARRGLSEAREHSAFGILGSAMALPHRVRHWPGAGYRIVLPLYDLTGQMTNVQGRCIRPARTKVLFPAGSRARAVAFANTEGLALLGTPAENSSPVLLGEGLTDHLALTITAPGPVLSVPGTSVAASIIEGWVQGRSLLLAFDDDRAGRSGVEAVKRAFFRCGGDRLYELTWPRGCNDANDTLLSLGAPTMAQLLQEKVNRSAS